MNIDFLPEPKLQFGTDSHVDIRYGLMNYGLFDFHESKSQKDLRIGLVGTSETMESVSEWLERCSKGIEEKKSRQPGLFTHFPGFGKDKPLTSGLQLEPQLQRLISRRDLDSICAGIKNKNAVEVAVNFIYEEMEYLIQDQKVDVIICALPWELLNAMGQDSVLENSFEDEEEEAEHTPQLALDFHHLLKAKSMRLNTPIQLIKPSTYGKQNPEKREKGLARDRQLQDEATRAWNFYIALYYKSGGIPWRMIRESSALPACFIGISFYKSIDQEAVRTSVAQIFDERGDGIIVRGGRAQISRDDRTPHLTANDSNSLLQNALAKYRKQHFTIPARVVLHKSSSFTSDELEGIRNAMNENGVQLLDCISMRKSWTRLFRSGAYPPLRGTLLNLGDNRSILYTRGSVDFFRTYPGMYVPRPIEFWYEDINETPKKLAQEILALTKMNWNNTQFDGSEPITLRVSRRVGEILKYVDEGDYVAERYSYYM